MPYLDEDILYNNVEEKYKSAKGKAREAYSDVLDTICEMPRADVVPKSEVEKIFGEIETDLRNAIRTVKESGLNEAVKKAKLECYEEDMMGYLAELKKKYTEENYETPKQVQKK